MNKGILKKEKQTGWHFQVFGCILKLSSGECIGDKETTAYQTCVSK